MAAAAEGDGWPTPTGPPAALGAGFAGPALGRSGVSGGWAGPLPEEAESDAEADAASDRGPADCPPSTPPRADFPLSAAAPGGGRGGAVGEGASYADALQDRLHRIRDELETQAATAIALRASTESMQTEADSNAQELARVRARWAEQQPQREALLREAGEAERRLSERERRCAEALASHAAAELSRNAGEEAAHGANSSANQGTPSAAKHSAQLSEQRQRLAHLEQGRAKLAAALMDLRDAARKETADISQLALRNEALRKESRALRAGAEASREAEERALRKLEALDATGAASQQRQQLLERQAEQLRAEVQTLRAELSAAAATCDGSTLTSRSALPATLKLGAGPPTSARPADQTAKLGDQTRGVSAATAAADPDQAVWATNRRLQAKVEDLQEELRKRQAVVRQLRARLASGQAGGGGAGGEDLGAALSPAVVAASAPEPLAQPVIV